MEVEQGDVHRQATVCEQGEELQVAARSDSEADVGKARQQAREWRRGISQVYSEAEVEGSGNSGSGRGSHVAQLGNVLQELSFSTDKSIITRDELAEGLRKLGYTLEVSELDALLDQLDLDGDGHIVTSEFVASQMDWDTLQQDYKDLWLQCVQRTFAALDVNKDGRLGTRDLIAMLKDKLPASEVEWALEDALVESGYADADEMDFEGFLRMVKVASHDSLGDLDQYESRLADASGHFQPELETLEEEK